MNVQFLINSSLLGVGVAMDAFSVSLANGLNEPKMSKNKILTISVIFAFFQALMPLIGWGCIHTILKHFKTLEKVVPWFAFFVLLYIGIKMIYDGIKKKNNKVTKISFLGVMIQALATSIDALSVGFTIANYKAVMAIVTSLIIFLIAVIICVIGFYIGKKFGTVLSNKATIFGGIILIIIGIEILILGVLWIKLFDTIFRLWYVFNIGERLWAS